METFLNCVTVIVLATFLLSTGWLVVSVFRETYACAVCGRQRKEHSNFVGHKFEERI